MNNDNTLKFNVAGKLIFKGNFNEKSVFGKDKTLKIRFSVCEFNRNKLPIEEIKIQFSNPQFMPQWLTDETKEYINYKSLYQVPVFQEDGVTPYNDIVTSGSDVVVATKVKNGAIYPVAIKIVNIAPVYNPFE